MKILKELQLIIHFHNSLSSYQKILYNVIKAFALIFNMSKALTDGKKSLLPIIQKLVLAAVSLTVSNRL